MRGKIVGFYGTWGSGLAQIQIDTEGGLMSLACENGPTVRALNALFSGFITNGHNIDNSVIEGQEITYEMDDMGLILVNISRYDPNLTQPPQCPNCGNPLLVIEWEEHVTYYYNPEKGHYEDEGETGRNPWGGVGYSKCSHCNTVLNDMYEFEDGPINYKPKEPGK